MGPDERVVIVDDILTTGASLVETVEAVRAAGAEPVAAAVLVDRSTESVELGFPLHALGRIEIPSWPPDDCPLCDEGVAAPEARQQLAGSALGASGEVPGREVERGDDVGAEAEDRAADQRRVRPDAAHPAGPSASRYDCVKRRFVTGRMIRPPSIEPDAVPGEAGDDHRARVEDAGVPEVGDEQAALDAAEERVRSTRRPGSSEEVRRQRPERLRRRDRVARSTRRRRRLARCGGRGRGRVVTPAARGRAAASACPRVEGDAQRRRVAWRRRQSEIGGVELRLAEVGEGAALVDGAGR